MFYEARKELMVLMLHDLEIGDGDYDDNNDDEAGDDA
jgi:hypothetical protein